MMIGIVVNERGAERAIATGAVRRLGFPYSISATFPGAEPEADAGGVAARRWRQIQEMATTAGVRVVAYVSMAFGNPYGDAWSLAR